MNVGRVKGERCLARVYRTGIVATVLGTLEKWMNSITAFGDVAWW